MTDTFKSIAALLITATLYGFFGVFSRLISFNIPFFFQQWVRNLFAVLFFGILIAAFGKWKKIARDDLRWFFLRSICAFISFIGIYIGFLRLSFGTNYFISYASFTIGGYLIGTLFFNEKINTMKALSLALSIIGLCLIYSISINADNIIFIVLSSVAGLANAGWSTFSKKISASYSNLQINFFDFLFATILPFIISVILREKWVVFSFNILWLFVFLFGLIFMISGILIVYGFSHIEAQIGSLILLFDVVVGIIIGYIIFRENITLPMLTGGVLILSAIIIPNLNLHISIFKKEKR